MQKPEIISADLGLCAVNEFVALAAIPGGAATFAVCQMPNLDEIVSNAAYV
ncbi:hypothetical protein [Clostridium botulinum]|uniref:Bacteriocin boticin B n=2 Tax=Clostridium botulinum TaxID=1491 RepID=Q9KGZ4_CLOBO|nr:hypothetical protein [Clostridium botulinum]AAF87749.1 bacteriocin boticin B [Clostridium botulinum]MBY6798164.1 hypothetical protein [Clostridium botulinum]MBY6801787.1 hypothetical protein [Clostridium botulinum]MBY6815377.1 hypothetical protein [Clostridium botulinum]MBY6867928.1 hypothetical protein [Clostridium botulinum]